MRMTYKDNISNILHHYDNGNLAEYGLIYSVAWAKLGSGSDVLIHQGEAIRAKIDGIFKDYADRLVVRMLTVDNNKVSKNIVYNVEGYLSGEFSASTFVVKCIDTWLSSPCVKDEAYAHGRQIDLSARLAQLADLVYTSVANELVDP